MAKDARNVGTHGRPMTESEIAAWVQFAAAVLSRDSGPTPGYAAAEADVMLEELRRRSGHLPS